MAQSARVAAESEQQAHTARPPAAEPIARIVNLGWDTPADELVRRATEVNDGPL